MDMNDCHDNATCIDTEGSYKCECKEGFSGSGVICEGTSPLFLFDLMFSILF